MREEDRERLRLMTAQSFTLPLHRIKLHASTPLEEAWVLATETDLQGALRVELIGQYFGGRSVPSAAMSAVQIMPQARGHGFGSLLMNHVLSELRHRGVALSVLYPANMGFYRSLGYEVAGSHTRYQLPILATPRERSLSAIEACGDESFESLSQCYKRLGESSCGLVDRSDRWWKTRVLNGTEDHPVHRYVVRNEAGVVTGYIIYAQSPEPSSFDYSYSLICQDLVWHDRDAAHALLNFAASHLVVGVNLSWAGPAEEPLGQLLRVQQPQIQQSYWWMVRLLNVKSALEMRGYSGASNATVDLTVTDPNLPENAGSFRIELRNGSANVIPISRASAVIDVGSLAAIYTGWLSARESVRVGGLQNASSTEVEALEKIFASPRPWCLDRF
jgi:predicted acetyltransferase